MEKSERWCFLPDEILHNIFSRIDFLAPTSFSLEIPCSVNPDMSKINTILENLFIIFITGFIKTVNLALPSYLCLKPPSIQLAINSWIRQICRYNTVQHLKVTQNDGYCRAAGQVDGPSIFFVSSLKTLDLDLYHEGISWNVPKSINLPILKKLSLTLAYHTNVETLIRSCPLLEDLTFIFNKRQKGSLLISSKTLKRLRVRLSTNSNFEVIIDAPNLEHFDFSDFWVYNNERIKRLLGLVSQVKLLVLGTYVSSKMLYGKNSRIPTIFPNMTHLTLCLCSGSFERFEELDLVLHCPNLEILVLKYFGCTWKDLSDMIPEVICCGLFKNVKRLELHTRYGSCDEELLIVMERLVRSSPRLEKLIVTGGDVVLGDRSKCSLLCEFEQLGV